VARPVSHGDDRVAAGLSVRVMHTPGHTRGSVSYLIEDLVFTGDTLFGAGCGRIFEGTAAMLYASICALACLPPATRVCFGHEYTADNLRFALELQPEQRAAAERLAKIALPSAPSTIAEEIATNPFLRCADPDLAARVGKPGADPAAVFAALRAMKDGW
jgi:hydroxyacylglutathione hydrolase